MSYDRDQFPHYGKVSFPENLQTGEAVWTHRNVRTGIDFGGRQTSGPFTVVSVQDRPESTTPLVRVRSEAGIERELCASMLTREKPLSIEEMHRQYAEDVRDFGLYGSVVDPLWGTHDHPSEMPREKVPDNLNLFS